MKKNSQIHLFLETNLAERLRKQADDMNISISELCRRKLKEIPQLMRIEFDIAEINKKLNNQLNFKREVNMVKNKPEIKQTSVDEELDETEEDEEE